MEHWFVAVSLLLHAFAYGLMARFTAESPRDLREQLHGEVNGYTVSVETQWPGAPLPPPHTSAASHSPQSPSAGRRFTTPPSEERPGAAVVYGAIVEAHALDMLAAFTRAFPQALSGNRAWLRAPVGQFEGTLEIILTGDGSFNALRWIGSAAPELREAVDSVWILLKFSRFPAAGVRHRWGLRLTVTETAVHGGASVFAIGASHEHRLGTAFFELAEGRRVSVDIRVEGQAAP